MKRLAVVLALATAALVVPSPAADATDADAAAATDADAAAAKGARCYNLERREARNLTVVEAKVPSPRGWITEFRDIRVVVSAGFRYCIRGTGHQTIDWVVAEHLTTHWRTRDARPIGAVWRVFDGLRFNGRIGDGHHGVNPGSRRVGCPEGAWFHSKTTYLHQVRQYGRWPEAHVWVQIVQRMDPDYWLPNKFEFRLMPNRFMLPRTAVAA